MANKQIKKTKTVITKITEEITTNERTHIVCILDRSGSMSSIMDDSIGGFNEFLKTQKELLKEHREKMRRQIVRDRNSREITL